MANRYWVATTGGNWSSTSSWSATSGGSSGASVPDTNDNVYFDSNSVDSSSRTITIDTFGYCNSLTIDGLDDTCSFAQTAYGTWSAPFDYYSVTVYNDFIIGTTSADLVELNIIHSSTSPTAKVDLNNQEIGYLGLYYPDNSKFYYTNIVSSGTVKNLGEIEIISFTGDVIFSKNVTLTIRYNQNIIGGANFSPYTVYFDNTTLIFDDGGANSLLYPEYSSGGVDESDIQAYNTSSLNIEVVFRGNNVGGYLDNWLTCQKITVRNYSGNSCELQVYNQLNCGDIVLADDNITLYLPTDVKVIVGKLTNYGTDNTLSLYYSDQSALLTILDLESTKPFTVEGYTGDPVVARIGNGALGSNITLNNIGLTNTAYPEDSANDSLPIKYRVKIKKNELIIKEYLDLTAVDLGQKNINTLSRQSSVKIAMTPQELKASKTYIEKYNNLEIIEHNRKNPSGSTVFNGYIIRHSYDYIKGLLTLYLISSGSIFDRRILEDDYTQVEILTDTYDTQRFFRQSYLIYDETINFDTELRAIEADFNIGTYAQDTLSTNLYLEVYSSKADALAGVNALSKSFITSTNTVIDSGIRWVLKDAINVNSGTTLWFKFTNELGIYCRANTGTTSSGTLEEYNLFTDALMNTYNKRLEEFSYYDDGADTTFVTGGANAEYWFKEIMRNATYRSIDLDYNMKYLQPPNYDFDYTFNTNTYNEVMSKFVEMATEDTYFYYDDVKNILIYKQNSRSPDVSLAYQDLASLDMDIDANKIANEVFFTGGDTGSGNLYLKFKDTNSQAEINQILQDRLNDSRVTLNTTAEKLSNRFLNTRKYVEFNATASISKDKWLDYNIEIGSVVVVTGIEGSDYPSLYDVAKFDVNVWDYNTADIGSNVFIVVSISESDPNVVSMNLGTLPPSLFTDVAYANKKLTLNETANNDTAPS